MRQRLLWMVLTGLLIAAVVFSSAGARNARRLTSGDSISLVYKIALLVFVGASVSSCSADVL